MEVSVRRKGGPAASDSPASPTEFSFDTEIQQSFREFRESAVRLVERVTDVAGAANDPAVAAQNDLRIVRSIFGKWSADVLLALHVSPSIGFEDLRRSLPGISPRVLSLKLKELEQHRMVSREILDTRPPRVHYSLTERGWTVTWLAQPIFLFLRMTETHRAPHGLEEGNPPAVTAP